MIFAHRYNQEANMKISSPAFGPNQKIPRKYTCDGENISPPLEIEAIPEETETLVLIVTDPDASAGTWVHWVVFNIPVTERINEGEAPGNQGVNDFNKEEYGGPCPQSGSHRYFFKLFALDQELGLSEGSSRRDVDVAMEGHILAQAELIGIYER
jgi:Raf kinase inhibitor-like YbhB/YbcL family protein